MGIDIRNVKDMTGLISYFADKLQWKIDPDDFDDIEDVAYDFDAEDIGLKEEAFAKIKSLLQLPPLVDGQKWGIFCVEFDSRRFEVTALRKILSGLIPKRRNSIDHAVWEQKDLLFLCFWGKDNDRTIGVAHFEEKESGLPTIKMISCAPAVEDFTQIRVFEDRLKSLRWPMDYVDHDKWHDDWSDAFTTGYKQTIQDASILTTQLAREAQAIRNRILEILNIETVNGYVHLLYEKFRNTLIHDLTELQFADMYAQTVVYGLFSARCMDDTQEDFSAAEAIECIPNTNPFLKSLMQECLGTQNNSKLSFDELEIGNVVDLLLHTKTDLIIQDFNRQTGGGKEDPVIHFYEEFLTAYDKQQKVQRGVFYTPQPIVNFIIRAVDSIIKNEFGLEEGLASTATKKIKVSRQSKKKINGFYRNVETEIEVPAIQVLDPATGTGTFIRQTILQIYDNFKKKNKSLSKEQLHDAWNDYVPKHLFPRINAFEIMMAPYAVAHMKLAMVLKDTGYDFHSGERLNVFLTNTLEEPGDSDNQISLWSDPLAMESVAANSVKKNNGINICIGNPPYAISTANKNEWIEKLLQPFKMEPGGVQRLKEQKHSIDSDEIKFLRYGQYIVNRSDVGIVAYINPHAFLDKPTFRGVRWQLLQDFDDIYVINLHGNSNHQEKTPDGKKDENVFDIQQGVCINILVKKKSKQSSLAKVYYVDVFGERSNKYIWLNKKNIQDIVFKCVEPKEPYYMMVPYNTKDSGKYYEGFCLEGLFTKHLEGIQSGKDKLVIQKSKEELDIVIKDLLTLDTEEVRKKYQLGKDGRDWSIGRAQEDIKANYPDSGTYFQIAQRPFDKRWSFYTGRSSGFIKCCRSEVSKEMVDKENIAMTLTRNAMPQKPYSNFHIVNTCTVGRYIGDFSTSTQVFPIYSYISFMGKRKKIGNVNKDIIEKISKILRKEYVDVIEVEAKGQYCLMDLVDYIFATLTSSYFREKYKEYLCRDFPYIPYPVSSEMFWDLKSIGKKLRHIHINYESIIIDEQVSNLMGTGDNIISTIKKKEDKVFINKTQFFSGISDEIWEYWIAGHQIVQKWLKDRKGEKITGDEINHFRRILIVVQATIEYSKKIDTIICKYI